MSFVGEKCTISKASSQSYTFNSSTGHWTQVVWQGSQKMSCAQLEAGGVMYCHYYPAGNIIGSPAYSHPPTNNDCKGKSLNQQSFAKEVAKLTKKTIKAPNLKSKAIGNEGNAPQTSSDNIFWILAEIFMKEIDKKYGN